MRQFLLPIVLCLGCASTQALPPPIQIQTGLRPASDKCLMPSDEFYVFRRLTASCFYYDKAGPASCSYFSRIDLGEESWLCAMGAGQEKCEATWTHSTIQCIPWQEEQHQKFMNGLE